MENEKKKLLLVAISVGIFLVIAIGAAILVITPRAPAAPASVSGNYPSGGTVTAAPATGSYLENPAQPNSGYSPQVPMDALDIVRSSGDVPGLQSLPEGQSRHGADIYVSGAVMSGEESATPASGTVINVPRPSSAAVPDAAPAGRAVAAARPASKPAQTSPAPAAKPAPQAVSQPRPAPQPKVYDDYWVQTGAFATVGKAEGVKDTLASKGITSIIENREVDGKILFRVRVGPYTSKNEADYWLSLIKSIGGFEDSQVRQTRR